MPAPAASPCHTLSPRSGLLIYPEGPLSLERGPEQMSRVFSPFYNLLKKIRYGGKRGGHGCLCGVAVGRWHGAHAVPLPQGPAAGAVSGGALPAGEEPVHSRIGGSLQSGHPSDLGGSHARSGSPRSMGSPGGPSHHPPAPHLHGAVGPPRCRGEPRHGQARGGLRGEGAGPGCPDFSCHPVGDHRLPPYSPQPPRSGPGPRLEAPPGARRSELRSHYSSTKDMLHTLFVCISGE